MGYYDLSLTYITVLTSILFFDIWVSILRYMYDGTDVDEKAVFIRSGGVIFAISSMLYITVGLCFAIFANVKSLTLVFAYGLSMNITNIFTFSARGYGCNLSFAISGIINSATNVASNLILILAFSTGYQSLYISGILGNVFQILYLALKTNTLKALFNGEYNKTIIKNMFIYSLPLCFNSVSYWLLTSFNRVIINWIYGNSANGIYAIGNKFAFVIGLVTTCFTYAWQEISFSEANRRDNIGVFYSKACNLYSLMLGMSMVLMLPFIKIIFPVLINESYAAAADTIPLFLITAVFAAISTFIGNIFYAIKDTKIIFVSMLISAIFNLIIGYPMIKLIGLNGANLAIVLSFIVNILIRNKILYKKIGFSLSKQLLIPMSFIVVGYCIYSCFGIWVNIAMFCITLLFSAWLFRKYFFMIVSLFFERT